LQGAHPEEGGGGDPPWGGHDAYPDGDVPAGGSRVVAEGGIHTLHDEHHARGGDQVSGWGGHALRGRPPDVSDNNLDVPRDTFHSDKHLNVPSDTFAVKDLEDFVKFAKKGPDIHLLKKTSSDQLELPQQGAFCLRHPEDSGGGDIVGVQINVFPLGLATAYSCAS
jgi:hypothetical protein